MELVPLITFIISYILVCKDNHSHYSYIATVFKYKPLQKNIMEFPEDIHLVCLGGCFINNFERI